MNAGILPMVLLFLAAALALSWTSWRGAAAGVGAAVCASAVAALILGPQAMGSPALEWIFVGLWLSAIGTIGSMYVWTSMPLSVATAIGLNAGAWAGALAAGTSIRAQAIWAIPILLLAIPGLWLIQRGYGIALKVVGGWIIAIAILAIFVSLTPTPGYKPDHMQ